MTDIFATVSYLYGVAALRDGLYDVVAPLRGVAGAPVRLVPAEDAGLAAVVSSVPAGDFEAAPLAAHLEDLAWLEAVARAHHHVIDAVAAAGTILPLRLATIYRDDERVHALITADRAAFARRLSHVDGRVEWGVKIYYEPRAAPAASTTAAPAAGTSPGRAYLRSRHQERNARQDAFREAANAARNVDAAARAHAVAHARHRLQQGPLAEDAGENIVNDAYLVSQDRADAFRQAVLSAAGQSDSIRVEITGPWAPYSFAATALDENGEQGQEVIT
ncbi:GvpL/GvpF family gas vesicle protein [Streptomyces agglomeratus]|uniref:GvpL/GvpF family gas vesicle protein n=1 Tax=Streptomyces agglomeratus TaxID=285458 RepID=UPI000854E661|nr:GvpL/GvpF family gas vesicle protein [Streptomyces agglomeratus]OEJ50341.1 gas vesicle protein [Streptomyces agglomeratus]